MKVAASNQTLILAGEQLPARSGGYAAAAVQHVTVIAAHPGSTVVVVNGDYPAAGSNARTSIAPAASRGSIATVATSGDPVGRSRDSYGNPGEPAAKATLSSYLRPAEQYARTQRNLESAASRPNLDVRV